MKGGAVSVRGSVVQLGFIEQMVPRYSWDLGNRLGYPNSIRFYLFWFGDHCWVERSPPNMCQLCEGSYHTIGLCPSALVVIEYIAHGISPLGVGC